MTHFRLQLTQFIEEQNRIRRIFALGLIETENNLGLQHANTIVDNNSYHKHDGVIADYIASARKSPITLSDLQCEGYTHAACVRCNDCITERTCYRIRSVNF